jgi:hypothetical protein
MASCQMHKNCHKNQTQQHIIAILKLSPNNNPSRLWKQAWLLELSIFFLEAKSTVDMVVLPNQVVAMSKPRKGKNFNQEKET